MLQTIGTVFAAKRAQVNDVSLVMGIWDTAGSEKYIYIYYFILPFQNIKFSKHIHLHC